MRNSFRRIIGLAAVSTIQTVSADTIYSGFLNTAIPLDFTGVTVPIEGGTINPFFGGVGVANNDLLQPYRDGTANTDTLLNFSAGTTLNASTTYLSTGYGGSEDHLGTTFTAGQEGYIGFKLNGTDYGWMRVIFTDNVGGAKIMDWAYDDSGASLVVGAVRQELTNILLTSGFVLASPLANSGGTTNVVKSGASTTTTLNGINTYTGSTTITSGTLKLGATGTIDNTSEVSLGTSGTFDVTAKGLGGYTVNNLTGSGDVAGNLSVSSQLAIGNAVGTVNFSAALTLGSGSTYLYELTGGATPGLNSADLGDVTGDLTITAGSILDLVQLGTYTLNNKFTLFAYDGTLSGTFNNLADGATFTDAGGVWMIDYNDTTAGANGGVSASNQYVTITAIPEANVAALLGGLGLLVLLRRRR